MGGSARCERRDFAPDGEGEGEEPMEDEEESHGGRVAGDEVGVRPARLRLWEAVGRRIAPQVARPVGAL